MKPIEERAQDFAESDSRKRYSHTLYAAAYDGFLAGYVEAEAENARLRDWAFRMAETIRYSALGSVWPDSLGRLQDEYYGKFKNIT